MYQCQLLRAEEPFDILRIVDSEFGSRPLASSGLSTPSAIATPPSPAALTRKGDIAGAMAVLEVESRRRVAMTAGISSDYEWLMLSEHLAQVYRRVDRVGDAVARCSRSLTTVIPSSGGCRSAFGGTPAVHHVNESRGCNAMARGTPPSTPRVVRVSSGSHPPDLDSLLVAPTGCPRAGAG